MGIFTATLSSAAQAQIRSIIREELRTELDRIISPTFVDVCRRGTDDLELISDAIASYDKQFEDLSLSFKILAASVEGLRKKVEGAS